MATSNGTATGSTAKMLRKSASSVLFRHWKVDISSGTLRLRKPVSRAFNRKDNAGVKQDLEMVYSYFPRLKDLRRNIAGYLSGGEQQMVVIGRAMMANQS